MYVTTGLHTLEGIVKNSNMFEYSYSQKKKKQCQICSQEKLNAREVTIMFLRENVGFIYFLENK